jgi:hypothetical protein
MMYDVGGLYPQGQTKALHGLAVVLEKADTSGGAPRALMYCYYTYAFEMMWDDDDVRLAVMPMVTHFVILAYFCFPCLVSRRGTI